MRSLAALGLALAVGLAVQAADPPAKPLALDVWPGKPPGETGIVGEETSKTKQMPDGTTAVTSLTNVSKPMLFVHRPPADKNTGVAVLVFPGGGYNVLAWDHEGEQVARWLTGAGITAAVLKYRVPRRDGTTKGDPPVQALMDAQRAVGIVRSRAAEWGVDPKKIGALGFSAGGHLTVWLGTNTDKRAYDPVDAADNESCRPDFLVPIYPGGLIDKEKGTLRPEIRVTKDTPPTFLVTAYDDAGPFDICLQLMKALKGANVPAELHVYTNGGHGFGLRPTGKPAATWPARCEEWLRDTGVLKAAGGH